MRTKVFDEALIAFCSLAFVCLLFRSAETARASAFYLRLCGERVVPALFVFSVLAGRICSAPFFYRLCALPFFGAEAAILLLGLLGGFPLGALTSVRLYEDGRISKRQAEYLCAFTNNASLSFITGYTGDVLGSRKAGVLLALLTAASACLIGLVLKYTFLGRDERYISPPRNAVRCRSFPTVLSESCLTMLTVCGSIVFFGSVGAAFPAKLRGFFELCGGISACGGPVEAASLLGFSGFAVMLQTAAVCEGRFSVKPFLLSKLAQSVIMTAAAYFVFG